MATDVLQSILLAEVGKRKKKRNLLASLPKRQVTTLQDLKSLDESLENAVILGFDRTGLHVVGFREESSVENDDLVPEDHVMEFFVWSLDVFAKRCGVTVKQRVKLPLVSTPWPLLLFARVTETLDGSAYILTSQYLELACRISLIPAHTNGTALTFNTFFSRPITKDLVGLDAESDSHCIVTECDSHSVVVMWFDVLNGSQETKVDPSTRDKCTKPFFETSAQTKQYLNAECTWMWWQPWSCGMESTRVQGDAESQGKNTSVCVNRMKLLDIEALMYRCLSWDLEIPLRYRRNRVWHTCQEGKECAFHTDDVGLIHRRPRKKAKRSESSELVVSNFFFQADHVSACGRYLKLYLTARVEARSHPWLDVGLALQVDLRTGSYVIQEKLRAVVEPGGPDFTTRSTKLFEKRCSRRKRPKRDAPEYDHTYSRFSQSKHKLESSKFPISIAKGALL